MSEQATGLAKFLASMKDISGGRYGAQGDYENGVRPFGAYGMLVEAWEAWSSAAGLGGMDKRDPAAQDAVAGYWAQKLFQRYGDWEMVAAAWFAGAKQTDQAVSSGLGVGYFKHPNTQSFLKKYQAAQEKESVTRATVPGAAQQWINPQGAPRGWLSPVAGPSEYSNSFRVPRNNRLGIHGAIDVYAAKGAPIVAPVGGRVLSTKFGDKGGYTVRVQGDDGLTYYFAHMNEASVVKPGQQIQAGAHLGFVGNSGNARGTKPHLHFSVRKGNTPVNPYTYLEGSRNAGNYYAPDAAAAHGAEDGTRSTKDRYQSLLNVISNQVAGGERTDYRTLGGVEETDADGATMPTKNEDRKETI